MNNNRNNRRRGRGNRNSGGGNQLNRIDSRARGNAPQMLEKYKKLAQDAQHNGDRVQAEYYLQFADHYFRVIADNKARQEEARSKRNEDRGHSDDEDGEDDEGRRNEGKRSGKGRSRTRRDDNDADSVPEEGDDGVEGEAADGDGSGGSKRKSRKSRGGDDRNARVAPKRKPRSKQNEDAGEIDSSVLPPAIGSEEGSSGDGDDNLESVG